MNRTWALGVVAIPLTCLLASCGQSNGPALYPVTGSVTYKGQPATGALVIFRNEGGNASSSAAVPPPSGQVDEQGKFSLTSGDLGWGAPVGSYKVLIQWRTRERQLDEVKTTAKPGARQVVEKSDGIPDILNGRYMAADVTRLRAEVKPESNELPAFDISR